MDLCEIAYGKKIRWEGTEVLGPKTEKIQYLEEDDLVKESNRHEKQTGVCGFMEVRKSVLRRK